MVAKGCYRYYSTQRPISLGTYPRPQGNKGLNIENVDERTYCEPIDREAWGYIEYEKLLNPKEIRDYELREAGPFFIDKSTGEMLSRQLMLSRYAEEYDGDDPTNAVGWEESFEEVK